MTTPIESSTPTGLGVPYLGISSPNPGNNWYRRRAPTSADYRNYQVLDRWINLANGNIYFLSRKASGSATWVQIATLTGGVLPVSEGGTGVATLTGLALGSGTSAFTGVTYTPATAWTPQLQIGGSSTGISTSTTPIGYYTQIGSLVIFSVNLILSNKGSNTGAVTISNMPVSFGLNGANMNVSIPFANVTLTTNYTDIFGFGTASSPVLNLSQVGSAQANTNLTNTQLSNTSSFFFSGLYFTT